MLDNVVTRRLAGTIGAILVVALGYLGLEYAFAPDAGSFTVEAELGTAGVGLSNGNSVKVRGVEIGQVLSTRYEDGRAAATLRLDPGTQIPKQGLVMQVTAKTLLGEKQVEFAFPDSAFGEAPFLAEGDVVQQSRQPTEVSDVLDTLTPFLDAIDEQDLATVVDFLGSQQGEGETIARGLHVSAQVSDFLARTADDTIDRFEVFTSVADQLTPAADEFDRLNQNLPAAVSLISDRTEDIDTNLDLLTAFSITIADYIEVEDERIRQLLLTTDAVGTVLDPNFDNLASIVQGAFEYTETLGRPSDFLTDGTIWAGFRIFLDLSTLGLPIGEGGLDLSPIFGDNSGGSSPVDVGELLDPDAGPLSDILPDGSTSGVRPGSRLEGLLPADEQPAAPPAQQPSQPQPAEPQPAEPQPSQPAASPSSDDAEQGSLLDGEDG